MWLRQEGRRRRVRSDSSRRSNRRIFSSAERTTIMSAAPSEEAVKNEPPVYKPDAPVDAADMFGGLKKKSKKKKMPVDVDLELEGVRIDMTANGPQSQGEKSAEKNGADVPASAEGHQAPVDDTPLDFGDLKKKKKKKAAFDLEEFEKELNETPDTGKTGEAAEKEGEGGGSAPDAETWQGTDRDYTYQELLSRIFRTLRQQNPALSGEKKKYTMVPPVVQRDGSKKTMFANVIEICKRMHRQPDHVIQYLFTELGTTGSVDGSQRLVIRGRFQPKQIENVLRRYIVEYVTCKTCRSPNTLLTKENRIYFMQCEACGSQRSVSAIKTGFQAQTGKRSKMRE